VLPAGDSTRRSVYLQVRRSKPVSMLVAFDAPVMAVNCERRVPSTTAPQSLVLMNSDFVLKQAAALATRVRGETPSDFAQETIRALAGKYQRPSEAWQFGYGAYDAASQRIDFSPLPHWTGSAWQGGPSLPDPAVGWAIVNGGGGHAGNDPQHASIRRWTAPRKGLLSIRGKLKHGSENGDGVRGRIVSSRSGQAGEWQAKAGETSTDVTKLAVDAGDTIDFAVDCVESHTSDSFVWTVDLTLAADDGQMLGAWNSASDFHGPSAASLPQLVAHAWQIAYQRLPEGDELAAACDFLAQQTEILRGAKTPGDHELAALTSLCQQLLSSNEFLYVD
jgi:hypothetical protein